MMMIYTGRFRVQCPASVVSAAEVEQRGTPPYLSEIAGTLNFIFDQ